MTGSVYRQLCSVAAELGWRVLLWTNTHVEPEERLDGEAQITMLSVFADEWNSVALVRRPGDSRSLDAAARQVLREAQAAGLVDAEEASS